MGRNTEQNELQFTPSARPVDASTDARQRCSPPLQEMRFTRAVGVGIYITLYTRSFWEIECRPNPGRKSAYWIFTMVGMAYGCGVGDVPAPRHAHIGRWLAWRAQQIPYECHHRE